MRTHSAEAHVQLGRLRRNLQIVQDRLGRVRLLFPVKGDGYGHGAVPIARVAEEAGVDVLGVANLHEARELRQAGIRMPILILSASRPELAKELLEAGATVSVSTWELAAALEQAGRRAGKNVKTHVKVDTGMGRNGVLVDEALDFVRHLHQRCPHIEVEGIFSHFSVSYSESQDDQRYTQEQIRAFNKLLGKLEEQDLLPPVRHIANSSGLTQYEQAVTSGYFNMVRPGILIYGYPEVRPAWAEEVRPILSLVSWIVSAKAIPADRYIGYGRHYRTDSERTIATLPVGYADGISPLLSPGGQVVIRGKHAPLVGDVSMDQLTVDVTHIPDARVGDEVELIGESLSAAEIAGKMGMSFTEIVLTALSPRVARVYLEP